MAEENPDPNKPEPEEFKFSGKAKLLATTGVICAMGGYICGDKIDENDKLNLTERPYEMAEQLLQEAAQKQEEWLEIKKNYQTTLHQKNLQIDSLERYIYRLEPYVKAYEEQKQEVQKIDEERQDFAQKYNQILTDYQNEENEVRIRDNQIDSLETLNKNYVKAIQDLNDEYKNRAPIENEFQAIHNCVNAHGETMYSYKFNGQVKCCIKHLKKLQKQYPNNDLTNIRISCND